MKQTICVNATPGDAIREATRVAENLRGTGLTVTIGKEYVLGTGHKAGMLAVDLTAELTAVVVVVPPPETETTVEAIPAFLTVDATNEDGDVLGDDGEPITNVRNPRRHPPRARKRQEVASGGSL